MSGTKTNFLLTGATGYIGGSILTRFLAHPHARNFQFTVLVRDAKKADKFNQLPGVKAVVGSHSDASLVEKLASEADVVIAAANCNDLGAAKATLEGLGRRHTLGTVPVPIFIHTSGTAVISDDAKGMYADETVYDDADTDQIESLAPTQPHRDVDLAITNADAEGYIKSYIILPPTIYGIATGRLVDMGLQNPHSIQIPYLISASLDRGRAGMVGEGKNVWPNVEIHELADLYVALYDAIVADTTGHGRNGFYFAESGEHSLYDVGKAIGEALVALGKSDSAEPTTFSQAELDKYFKGATYFGSNSRCRANRSLSIGWKPSKSTGDMLASIKPEMDASIKKAAAD
ncbi:NAD-binding protein [Mycena crocata]|nr:NAD-binding protein [Mycena crocata]